MSNRQIDTTNSKGILSVVARYWSLFVSLLIAEICDKHTDVWAPAGILARGGKVYLLSFLAILSLFLLPSCPVHTALSSMLQRGPLLCPRPVEGGGALSGDRRPSSDVRLSV